MTRALAVITLAACARATGTPAELGNRAPVPGGTAPQALAVVVEADDLYCRVPRRLVITVDGQPRSSVDLNCLALGPPAVSPRRFTGPPITVPSGWHQVAVRDTVALRGTAIDRRFPILVPDAPGGGPAVRGDTLRVVVGIAAMRLDVILRPRLLDI